MSIRGKALLAICLLVAAPAGAADCTPPELSAEAVGLVKPLMELRVKQDAEQYKDGVWVGVSQHTPELERMVLELLEERSSAGDEALAYLLNFYFGEGPSEKLVCEAIRRGERILPLINAFRECVPLIGLEPLPATLQGPGGLADHAAEGITKNEPCDPEP